MGSHNLIKAPPSPGPYKKAFLRIWGGGVWLKDKGCFEVGQFAPCTPSPAPSHNAILAGLMLKCPGQSAAHCLFSHSSKKKKK